VPTNTINRFLGVILQIIVLNLYASSSAQNSLAQCKAPKYRECFVQQESKTSIVSSISIRVENLAPERLVCLVNTFKQRYKDRKEIDIQIFDSCRAAERYFPKNTNYDPIEEEAATHMHGYYAFSANKNEEFVQINPRGLLMDVSDGYFNTVINLPILSKPQCRVQMHGRCLLALKDIKYPADAKKAGVTGTVTLAGMIDRQGIMTGIKIAETSVKPAEAKDLLANEAMENIKTWRFEKSKKKDPFRITYFYAINIPKGDIGQVEVRPELPDHIYINVNPWKSAK